MNPEIVGRSARADVLAVVVTYHPDADLAGNLDALRDEVGEVVVIDNGSPDFAAIEQLAIAAGCRVIGNGANLGVAAALNQAARLARDEGFTWLAMFDQDSRAPPGAIARLLAVGAGHPGAERVAVLAMNHRDRVTKRDYQRPSLVLEETPEWRSVRATITSGSLVRLEAMGQVGPFDETLFIDGVDHDFCLRCRRAGWLVIEARNPVLEHSLGAITHHRLMGRPVACTNHSAVRRYYITRNGLELSIRHLGGDPVWALGGVAHLIYSSMCALIFEQDRAGKASAMLVGALDFARRRFGPRLPGKRRSSD